MTQSVWPLDPSRFFTVDVFGSIHDLDRDGTPGQAADRNYQEASSDENHTNVGGPGALMNSY